MKISVFSLGCKVNQYEGGGLVDSLMRLGYDVSEGLEPADIFILNTCAVTNEAERKSRQAVSRIKRINRDAKIIVCGCASQSNHVQFEQENVIFIKGTAGKSAIVDEIAKITRGIGEETGVAHIDEIPRYYINDSSFRNKTRAYVKIADGCDNFCSYCIVPYLRGRFRSRTIPDILGEIDKQRIFKEIVLIGIDISSYGKDINSSLSELVKRIGHVRLRLGSLEISSITDDFLDALKDNPEFCPHFHLSLQSGSDEVLRGMNRKYSALEYKASVELIRKYFPEASIMTDVISGFPGESEENHLESISFLRKISFNDVHVFQYSPRKGTHAASMKQLDDEVKKNRTRELLLIKDELRKKWISSQTGKSGSVLIEGLYNNLLFGHEKGFMKVYVEKHDISIDTIAKIVMEKPFQDGVFGRIISVADESGLN